MDFEAASIIYMFPKLSALNIHHFVYQKIFICHTRTYIQFSAKTYGFVLRVVKVEKERKREKIRTQKISGVYSERKVVKQATGLF